MAERAAAHDVIVIDAPVSGARDAAERGELLVMTGGDADAATRCRPVFDTFGRVVLHMGPIGTAQRAKLVNNTLLTANLAMATDALALGAKLDIDPATLALALQNGSARSFALDVFLRAQSQGGMTEAGWGLLRKDVDLLIDAARLAAADSHTLVEPAERYLDQAHPQRSAE
jgi:3-hydroxyisobutyrate dehydrogenase-like beta-hydroxyacid dehydrogenase